jgi:hypothetical protein
MEIEKMLPPVIFTKLNQPSSAEYRMVENLFFPAEEEKKGSLNSRWISDCGNHKITK